MVWELFWDVETKSWFSDTGDNDPANLGVSLVSTYMRQVNDGFEEVSGALKSFWEKDFEEMWKLFRDADRIVGFNTLNFDVPAMRPYAPADFSKLAHFDILDRVKLANDGRGASLNAIAFQTLGQTKIDSGANAVMYWRKGDPSSLELLRKYCEADVLLTRDVYDHAIRNKQLKFVDKWNNLRSVQVDFSYPLISETAKQASLF